MEQFESPTLPGRGAGAVEALSRMVSNVEDSLRTKWVPNPFFYPTEKQLYDCTLVEGGAAALRVKAEAHLLEVKTRLGLATEARRASFAAISAGLLGAISVLSLDALLLDGTAWLVGAAGWSAGLGRFAGFALMLVAAGLGGLVIYRMARPDDRDG